MVAAAGVRGLNRHELGFPNERVSLAWLGLKTRQARPAGLSRMLIKGNMALPLISPGARRAACTPWMKARLPTTEHSRRGGRIVPGGPAQAIMMCERWNGLSAQARMFKKSVYRGFIQRRYYGFIERKY
jgi:hypothetical protein